jgi:hypothetical protein
MSFGLSMQLLLVDKNWWAYSFLKKGLFILYLVPIVFVALAVWLIWMIYRKQFQNLVRPLKYKFSFSGAPLYIAGSTSGSPLSDLGSYCGFNSGAGEECSLQQRSFCHTHFIWLGPYLRFWGPPLP